MEIACFGLRHKSVKGLAGWTGLEPAASAVTGLIDVNQSRHFFHSQVIENTQAELSFSLVSRCLFTQQYSLNIGQFCRIARGKLGETQGLVVSSLRRLKKFYIDILANNLSGLKVEAAIHQGRHQGGSLAKRFTDTDKWKREWFCELDSRAKLVWFYILDQCDHRGVWFQNFKLMSDQVGFKVSREQFEAWFGSKVRRIDEDKYFIRSFVDFQYKKLNPDNNAHKSVIELVSFVNDLGPSQDLMSPCQGAQDKVKDKDKVKEDLKGPTKKDFERVYREIYPRKEGKTKGIERAMFQVKTWDDFALFEKAAANYRDQCVRDGIEKRYQKHFSSWVSTWRECLDADYGQTSVAGGGESQRSLAERLRARGIEVDAS